MQVDPAAPVGFDALWNGADTNWYNPANWSPRGVPTATSRVYISAATTVVPRLTANVTVRDLFLEPGATLDTNGFTLTVTNNADAGHTIIGDGRTVLTGNGGTASGVFANLEIQGRITLTAPVTTTGTLTLGAGRAARAERPAADRRRAADHQRHRRGAAGRSSAPRNNLFLVTGRERQRPGPQRRAADDQRRRADPVRQRLVQRLRARRGPADRQQSRAGHALPDERAVVLDAADHGSVRPAPTTRSLPGRR